MKMLFIAGSALVAGSLSAFAADLSAKAPAPSPVAQLQTSGYVEFSAGGSWLDNVLANSPPFSGQDQQRDMRAGQLAGRVAQIGGLLRISAFS
jgi:hypothetical protein